MTAIDWAAEQATAEAEFLLDTIQFTRATGTPTVDPATATVTDTPRALVWTGPCSVSIVSAQLVATGPTVGVAYNAIIRLPVAATGLEIGDVAQVTAVRAGGNTELLRHGFLVAELPEASRMVLRRVHCTRIARPGVRP